MLTRLLGPLRGYFVSVSNLAVGEVGEQHVGMYRIYDHEPDGPFAPGPVREGTTSQPCTTRRVAMDQAEDAAFEVLAQLPACAAEGRSGDAALLAIAYVSTATRQPQPGELGELLNVARSRNGDYDVTGMLIYEDGQFLQYLEGPPAHVELVYHSVRKSPLHGGLVELMHKPVASRIFAEWSMGFQGGSARLLDRAERRALAGAPGAQRGEGLAAELPDARRRLGAGVGKRAGVRELSQEFCSTWRSKFYFRPTSASQARRS